MFQLPFVVAVPKHDTSLRALRAASRVSGQSSFVDDAILIEKYNEEFRSTFWESTLDVSTVGSISIHVNANREGNGGRNDHWMDFAVGW